MSPRSNSSDLTNRTVRVSALATPSWRWRAALYAIVCLLFALFIVGMIFFWRPSAKERTKEIVPLAQEQTLTLSELDRTLALFDPWHQALVDESGMFVVDKRALVLLQEDGGMRVSSWGIYMDHVRVENGFRALRPPEISGMTIKEGMVKFQIKRQQFVIAVIRGPHLVG